MTDYDYSVATDFGGSFHFASFKREIVDSSVTGFTDGLSRGLLVPNSDDEVRVVADAGQQGAIDALVTAHVGTVTTRKPQQKKSTGETPNATTNWNDKINKTAAAVMKGDYLLTFFGPQSPALTPNRCSEPARSLATLAR